MIDGLVEVAERLHASRRARDAAFGEDRAGFGEPGWDMFLALFIADGEGCKLSIEGAIGASAADAPVAKRYLEWLVSRELAVQDDRGVGLSDRGRALMIAYLERAPQ